MEEVLARALQLFIALTGAYALALWFALIVWTYRDISSRTTNAVTQVFSTLIVVLFFVPGAIIYLILRPRETLDDVFQRTMEEEYLLQDLDDFPVCPSCRRSVHDDFLFCPHCRTELRLPCITCHRLVDVRWESCPYCGVKQYEDVAAAGTDVGSDLPAARSTRAAKSGAFQSIDGGRSRDHRPELDEQPVAFHWEQETVHPVIGPEPLAQLAGDEDDTRDDAASTPTRKPPTARGGRDQGSARRPVGSGS